MRRLWMRWLLTLSALAGIEALQTEMVRLEVAVFLQAEVTEQQRRAVRKALCDKAAPTRLVYVSHDDAYAEFRQMFAQVPEAMAGTGPRDLPESFRFVLPDLEAFEAVEALIGPMPGVHRVVCRPAAGPPTGVT